MYRCRYVTRAVGATFAADGEAIHTADVRRVRAHLIQGCYRPRMWHGNVFARVRPSVSHALTFTGKFIFVMQVVFGI